jgi:hypothetical protein
MRNVVSRSKFIRILNATAGGFGDTIASSVIDTQGYDSVTFVVAFGAIAATGTAIVKAQQSSDNSADAYDDLLGSGQSVATAGSNKVALLEIACPQKRFVKCAVARATANVAIDSIIAILTSAKKEPVTQDATTVIGAKLLPSPAEGAA